MLKRVGEMKRTLLVLLLLTACGIHENIDEKMAEDTKQVMDIVDKAYKEDRDFTDREQAKLDDYQLLYGAKEKDGQLTEEESLLLLLVSGDLIDRYDTYSLMDSNKEFYKITIDRINSVIKTGEVN